VKDYIIELKELSTKLELCDFIEFDPSLLIPEEGIRKYCYENICGNYGKHYMCPPLIGTVEEIKNKLKLYNKAILLRYSEEVDVKNNRKKVKRTKIDFHKKILELENFLSQKGIESWGLVGGNCSFCVECKAITNRPCKHPQKARPSLESLGIDVQKLLDNFGLDNRFYPDKIVWTGCILINEGIKR
jgi:predicted metal-binding protein